MPMNRADYPADWEQLSARVKAEANDCCEECGVRNGAYGYRLAGEFVEVPALTMQEAERFCRALPQQPKAIRIVLTVHHRDEDTRNNRRDNLVALCQRDHLSKHRRGRREQDAAGGQLALVL